jgi:pimeloyl-ACP methyl ester carboxylesterase
LRTHLDQLATPPTHRTHATLAEAAERIRNAIPGLSPEQALALAQRSSQSLDNGVRWRWDVLHRTRSPLTFVSTRFLVHLRAIRAPVLLIYGDTSTFRFSELIEREAAIPNLWRRAELPGGHHVHVDSPEATADLIGQFLDAQNASTKSEEMT